MRLSFSKWLFFRVILYMLSIYSAFTDKNPIIDIPYYIYILTSILFAFSMYFIIAQQCRKSLCRISYTEAFSISSPFYPMLEYPLQFWIFISLCTLFRGVASFLTHQFLDSIKWDYFSLILGFSMLVSIISFIKNNFISPNSKNA
jgi:hypothetical protein